MLPNEHWNHIKNVSMKSAKTNSCIEKKRPAKKPWVTEEMIKLMDERKKWKRVNIEVGNKVYRALKNRLRRSTDKARETWYKNTYDEIDQNIKEGRSGIAYRLEKEVTGKQKVEKRTQAIMDENGLIQTHLVNIKGRWKRYIEQLYAANEKPDTSPLEEEHEVPIEWMKYQ